MIFENEIKMNYLVCPIHDIDLKRETFSYFSLQSRYIPVPSGFIIDLYDKRINIKYDGLGELLIKLLLSSAITYHHLANNNLYPISNPVTWGETWEWVKLPKHAYQATQTN